MRGLVWLVCLLALGGVGYFAVEVYPARIAADLEQRSLAALTAANVSFARVKVHGRTVTLSGTAPGPTAKAQAIEAVTNVWGVHEVNDELVLTQASVDAMAPQAVVQSDTPPPAAEPAPTEPAPATPEQPTAPPAEETTAAAVQPEQAPAASEEPPSPAPAAEAAPPAAQFTSQTEPTPAQTEPAATPVVETPTAPPPEPAPTPAPEPAPVQTAAVAPAESAPATPEPAPPAPAIVEPPQYRLAARLAGKRVEIEGVVSTRSAQRALLADVRRKIRRAQIVDGIKIANAKPDQAWLTVARTGLAQLARLDAGAVEFESKNVTVSGRPKSATDREHVLAALNSLPDGYTSTVLLERMQDVEAPPPAVAPAPAAVAEPAPAPVQVAEPAPSPPRTTARRYRKTSKPVRVAMAAPPPASAAADAPYRMTKPSDSVEPAPAPVHRASLSFDCRRRFGEILPRMAMSFPSGSSRLEPISAPVLSEFAAVARDCPEARIRLTGHSDTNEVAPRALTLSRLRAYAVRDALVGRGVASSSITVAAAGGLRPAFSNATAEGRENNRRVEFLVR